MADIKISQLGAAIAVNNSDLLPIVSNGNTLKAPASLVKEYAVGNTDLSGIGDGTPTGAIAALNTELGTTKQALSNVESDIAPIEDGTNYSTSYTQGQQFIRGGLLYKVTASSVNSSTAINTGTGGNATRADSVTKQINDVANITATINSSAFTGNVVAKRLGNILIVNIDISSKNDIAAWTTVEVATLSGVTFKTWNEFLLVLQASNNYAVNGVVDLGSNVLKLSTRTGSIVSGNGLRGQLVAFVNY